MNFLDKLDCLMSKTKLNKHSFAEKSGISYNTIVGWYKRGYSGMTVSLFKDVCNYFGVTMDSMAYDNKEIEYVSDIGKHNKLSPAEKELLTNFGELDPIGKGRLLERSKSLIEDGFVEEKGESDSKKA